MKSIGILSLCVASLFGQVTPERLLKADLEPGNWLTYSGGYQSHRFSPLEKINRDNIRRLKLKWVHQMRTLEKVETTPLVVDGVMYVTRPPNDVFALDPETGRPFWSYVRSLPEKINVCCGQVNRGLAMLGNRLYMGTVDAHLVALDAKTGAVIWDVEVADRCNCILNLFCDRHVQQKGDDTGVGMRQGNAGPRKDPFCTSFERFFHQRATNAAIGAGNQDSFAIEFHKINFLCEIFRIKISRDTRAGDMAKLTIQRDDHAKPGF